MPVNDIALFLAGLVLTLVVQFLKNPQWSMAAKTWVVMLISVVISFLAYYGTGNLPNFPADPVGFVSTLAEFAVSLVGVATIVYNFFMDKAAPGKNTFIGKLLSFGK